MFNFFNKTRRNEIENYKVRVTIHYLDTNEVIEDWETDRLSVNCTLMNCCAEILKSEKI